ncbi:glutamic acid-rich protein-like [Telopea speciosissima]|uniref:glutamic acid-rich protein-like n=1 Tax=Telopea speciosissima TaxID=54955 RepID=UPI001CC5683A|nr:glutamic acid-rich protein-like [Telopea speciosissima]
MSRCFPYPPPGYERKSGGLDEALINSIKLQKKIEKAKKEKKKEKKREKKEKERERDKARENRGVDDKKQKHEKKHKNERGKVEHGVGDHPKRIEEEAEQLEKSSLTEEHGQPISSQNLYDSTDSTQNSHKRKRHSSPSDGSHSNHGSIFRIRLKQKDQEILPSKELPRPNSVRADHILQGKCEIPQRLGEEKHCSTSGREQQFSTSGRTPIGRLESLKQKDKEILSNQKLPRSNLHGKYEICPKISEVQHCSTSRTTTIVQESLKQKDKEILSNQELPRSNLHGKYEICPKISEVQHCSTSRTTTVVQERFANDPKPSEEQICSTSGRTDVQAPEIVESARKSGSKLKKIESLYRDLIENWVPPPIENNGTDFDDQEWLFETVSKSESEPKRFKPSNDGVCEGSTSIWPQACYLPEADIYVLPYAVPF